jgi:NADPH:quinone reductase-like Zn-dependent oxidoreductase
MIRRGKWYEMHNLPFIPGSDLVGTIHEIGIEASKSSTFKVGDRVAALVPSGGNAKYITIEYRNIIRVPPGVASERALCLSSTYVPAREALDLGRKMNTPFTGANILVIGGNGPSGLATIELALLEGACVFTTADERHHDHLTKLGAKCFAIDPAKWLPTLTGKMDVVLDSVCLDGYTSSSLALNSAGILVCTGMSAVYTQGAMPTLILKDARDVRAMYFKTRVKFLWDNAVYYDRMERFASAPNEYAVSDSLRIVNLSHRLLNIRSSFPSSQKQHFRYLCHLASKGTINPLVSTRAPLNLVASLQREIELGNTTYGICVCAPWTTQAASVTEGTAVPTTPP